MYLENNIFVITIFRVKKIGEEETEISYISMGKQQKNTCNCITKTFSTAI